VVLADLVRTVEDRTRAFDHPSLASFETWRRHASGVRRIRAIGQAKSVLGDAIEAEGGVDARPGNQISPIDVRAYRGRVERRAEAAVGAALSNGFFIYRVVEDGVDIHEVHAVWNVEALAVGIVAVGGQCARQLFGAGARTRVIAQSAGPSAAVTSRGQHQGKRKEINERAAFHDGVHRNSKSGTTKSTYFARVPYKS